MNREPNTPADPDERRRRALEDAFLRTRREPEEIVELHDSRSNAAKDGTGHDGTSDEHTAHPLPDVEAPADEESGSKDLTASKESETGGKIGGASIIGGLVGGGAALLTAFSILVALGWVAWTVISDHATAAHRAITWNQVDGVITSSGVNVDASRGSSRSSRALGRKTRMFLHRSKLDIVAEYQVTGPTLEARDLGGYGQPFIWRPTPAQLAARLPVGSAVTIQFDPEDSSRAVIDPGVAGWRLLELLTLIPIAAMTALALRAWLVYRRLQRDPLKERLRIAENGQVRLRMTGSSPWIWGLLWTALGALLAIVATLAAVGREPSVGDVALAAITALALGALAATYRVWTLGKGRHDLIVDDVKNVLVLPAALRPRSDASLTDDGERADLRMRTMLEERIESDTLRHDQITLIEAVEPSDGKGWLLRITATESRPGTRVATARTPIDLPCDSAGALWAPAAAEWLRENVVIRRGSRGR